MKLAALVGLFTVVSPINAFSWPEPEKEGEAPPRPMLGHGGEPANDNVQSPKTSARFMGMDWHVMVPELSEPDVPPQY